MTSSQARRPGEFRVAVIGAGVSGIYMAERLKQAGMQFTIFEKASELGGTWRDNNYPGLHVDVVSRSYEYPFHRNKRWSKRYPPGSEIQDYLLSVAADRGIREHIRFNTEISSCRYEAGRWETTTAAGHTEIFDAVVCATGVLRVPRVPSIPGLDTFKGAVFHSAEWDHSANPSMRRVGVIGMGSSGIQIVAKLGEDGYDTTHFIRTPQWIQVKPNPKISMLERFLTRSERIAKLWDRYLFWLRNKTDGTERWRIEPGEEREMISKRFHDRLRSEIRDPALLSALVPSDPVGCKRIPKSPHYYQVVQQKNVNIVLGPVTRIEPEGVVDVDGRLHELDTLVLATGFDAQAYMSPMTVIGEDAVSLEEVWREGPYSYRGVAIPGFPNFFMILGPFTPGNILPASQIAGQETQFVMTLLERSRACGAPLEPSVGATTAFVASMAEAIPRTTFSLCSNWQTGAGRLPLVWPLTRAEYSRQIAQAGPDFEVAPVAESSASEGSPA